MKWDIYNIGGKTVLDNDTYKIKDNNFLFDTTLSSTRLYAGKETRGHKHDDQEEVYFFIDGFGEMIIDGDFCAKRVLEVAEGDIVLVHKGCHHKVRNTAQCLDLTFICVLQGQRDECI